MKFLLALCFVVLCSVCFADDKVTQFPGWPQDNRFSVYSGYLSVSSKRNIHYIFLESIGKKETDPIVLWLNGGPGCSSMLGMIQEIGPYVWEDGEAGFQQNYNKYAWNQNTNLLFFESPPGVGFSENNDTDYQYNDTNTAIDSYNALQAFFTLYPTYNGRELWIAGESYAGIYVPFLANQTLYQNTLAPKEKQINLSGILVGNGVTIKNHSSLDLLSTTEFFVKHKMVSPQVEAQLKDCRRDNQSASCVSAQAIVDDLLNNNKVNPYNIYGYCFQSSQSSHSTSEKTISRILQSGGANIKDDSGEGIPCIFYKPIEAAVNVDSFRDAIHVNKKAWTICTNIDYHQDPRGSFWVYDNLIKNKLKILIYSGDNDAVVPYLHTEEWIYYLGRNVVENWRPWYISAQQIGGAVTVYDGLTFATVRGAGHMVPQWKREAAYQMFTNFVQGKKL